LIDLKLNLWVQELDLENIILDNNGEENNVKLNKDMD
jgi:hypothetical protein